MNELYMRAVEPKPPADVPLSDADKARYASAAKTYTRLMWRRDRVLKKDFSRKIALKWAALYALPTDELRQEALLIDPFVPMHLRWALETPPLAGFHGAEEAEKKAAAREAEIAAAASRSAAGVADGGVSMGRGRATADSRGRMGKSRGGAGSEYDFATMIGAAPAAPAQAQAGKGDAAAAETAAAAKTTTPGAAAGKKK